LNEVVSATGHDLDRCCKTRWQTLASIDIENKARNSRIGEVGSCAANKIKEVSYKLHF